MSRDEHVLAHLMTPVVRLKIRHHDLMNWTWHFSKLRGSPLSDLLTIMAICRNHQSCCEGTKVI